MQNEYVEILPGVRERRNDKNSFYVVRVHYSADKNKATQEWFLKTKKGMPKASWNKEYEIDFYALSGQRIWPEFDPSIHVISPIEIKKEWNHLRSIDFGQFNPTCCLWGAVDYSDNIYIYREYYQGGRVTASDHAKAIAKLSEGESYVGTFIDPSTLAKTQSKYRDIEATDNVPYSVYEIFYDNGVECSPANNDTKAGWDRVSEYMHLREYKVEGKDVIKPKLFIFENCFHLIHEIPRYRYAMQTPLTMQKKDPDEKQIKKEDHSCDALRYLVISRPPLPVLPDVALTRIQKDIRKTIAGTKSLQVEAWGDWNS